MKKKILILVSILVVFLAIPPFVNYWVSTPSPIGFIPIEKQEVWISFYASLIGSGITLLGVALTICYTDFTRKEDFRKHEQELKEEYEKRNNDNKNLVAKVKEIHQYMLNHIDEKLTIACLADKHQISATNLKKYFKEIYGLSIYAYLKEKRIQKAAELLRETNHEIGKIAGMVGYDNASKFSNSFKSIMGINPSEYKKSV